MPARRNARSLTGNPAGSMRWQSSPRQAARRRIVPVFWGISGSNSAIRNGQVNLLYLLEKLEHARRRLYRHFVARSIVDDGPRHTLARLFAAVLSVAGIAPRIREGMGAFRGPAATYQRAMRTGSQRGS